MKTKLIDWLSLAFWLDKCLGDGNSFYTREPHCGADNAMLETKICFRIRYNELVDNMTLDLTSKKYISDFPYEHLKMLVDDWLPLWKAIDKRNLGKKVVDLEECDRYSKEFYTLRKKLDGRINIKNREYGLYFSYDETLKELMLSIHSPMWGHMELRMCNWARLRELVENQITTIKHE